MEVFVAAATDQLEQAEPFSPIVAGVHPPLHKVPSRAKCGLAVRKLVSSLSVQLLEPSRRSRVDWFIVYKTVRDRPWSILP
mmetsp:Transcript_12793/g.36122  ORF Transcript_12793/g.36122 Transcript_12793/m.36122 type:complete len:81 (-) Transcript_12793:7-249(-)